MDKQQIKSLPPVPQANLMIPDIDTFELEATLEKDLKKKFEQIRKDEAGDATKWDKQLSYLLSTALINYEME